MSSSLKFHDLKVCDFVPQIIASKHQRRSILEHCDVVNHSTGLNMLGLDYIAERESESEKINKSEIGKLGSVAVHDCLVVASL